MKLKRGDKVIVISGKNKGSVGVIQKVLPKENKVVVEGVNVHKKHQKPTQANPNGSVVEFFAPIDASNVAYYDEKSKKPTKIGYKVEDNGTKVRVAKRSGKVIK